MVSSNTVDVKSVEAEIAARADLPNGAKLALIRVLRLTESANHMIALHASIAFGRHYALWADRYVLGGSLQIVPIKIVRAGEQDTPSALPRSVLAAVLPSFGPARAPFGVGGDDVPGEAEDFEEYGGQGALDGAAAPAERRAG